MGHHDHAVIGAGQLAQQLQHGPAADLVQCTGRLVGQQQLGAMNEGPGDGPALLFAAGQQAGPRLRAIGQIDAGQRLAGPGLARRAWDPTVSQGQRHVLQQRQARQQLVVLEDEADLLAAQSAAAPLVERRDLDPIEPVVAAGRALQAAKNVEQRGLPRSRGPDDTQEMVAAGQQRHPVEDRPVAKAVPRSALEREDLGHAVEIDELPGQGFSRL